MSMKLEVAGLCVDFVTRDKTIRALQDISFSVGESESVGIVGESGSGKSTIARAITQLLMSPGRVSAGDIRFDGQPLLKLPERELRSIRGRDIGFVAQNPFSALNPVLRLRKQFANIAKAHGIRWTPEMHHRMVDLLNATGVKDAERVAAGYAHELSGGMAQRVVISMALFLNPKFVIADEPTTALDLTVQKQVLNTLMDMTVKDGKSMLLVTHDLGVVAEYCDRVLVMYRGQLVEEGPVSRVFVEPEHEYTASLLDSVTQPDAAPVLGTQDVPVIGSY